LLEETEALARVGLLGEAEVLTPLGLLVLAPLGLLGEAEAPPLSLPGATEVVGPPGLLVGLVLVDAWGAPEGRVVLELSCFSAASSFGAQVELELDGLALEPALPPPLARLGPGLVFEALGVVFAPGPADV